MLFVSCSKQNNQEHRLSGRLMQSCETPAANKDGLIYFDGGGLLNNPSTTLEFTTDENGYFEVKHNEPFTEFSVRTSANHSVLEVNSVPDDNDLGEVYIFPPSVSYYLTLKVNNSYSELDTLHFGNPGSPHDGRDPWLKKVGPFSDGIIDTVSFALNLNGLPIKFDPPDHLHGPRISIRYYMNEYYSWTEYDNRVYITTPHCQNEYQTVTLVID